MLPQFPTDNKALSLLMTSWAKELNPLISDPMAQGNILKSVALINGSTTINHGLGRNLQGWMLLRVRAPATIYDTQDSNSLPNKTLILVSNAAVTVDLMVF